MKATREKGTSRPLSFRVLMYAAVSVTLLSGCTQHPHNCGPCPGSGVELTAHRSIVSPDNTYEVCDARDFCRKRHLLPAGASRFPTPAEGTDLSAEIQIPLGFVDLPGKATDYSRVAVRAVIKDKKGRIIGRGQATFPEYPPIEAVDPCYCYNASVQLDIYPASSP
ncbi:hypothetical protein IMZ11_41320 [Microtetraspora sp. AC03309]|uniref:hypothetical protein n=1 Tax=Microtetraspora sp. AC03309 TaxID=2779376 RepID=UPI001E36D207|nr:hypothetical protein [Microtetraspora sp. AC03309]MCC5582059.1 hypothetical protein [Microtetraspora sp. AC03309]